MDDWPFWQFEENIKYANEIIQDDEKARKKEEETQKQQMPNVNTNSMMSGMSGMMNKFKK